MPRNAQIMLRWADSDYLFRLPLGMMEELQEKCNAGPKWIYNALGDDSWRISYVRETIRLGLIGGGCDPIKALNLVRRYVDERPWMENILIAQTILGASLIGAEDEQPGKSEAAKESAEDHSASLNGGSSPLPQSMEMQP